MYAQGVWTPCQAVLYAEGLDCLGIVRVLRPLKRSSCDMFAITRAKLCSLTQAAAIASLDYTHFAEYFRDKTGVTFKYWIDFIRIARAARMLECEDKSVT